jgi:hypothetical protein
VEEQDGKRMIVEEAAVVAVVAVAAEVAADKISTLSVAGG